MTHLFTSRLSIRRYSGEARDNWRLLLLFTAAAVTMSSLIRVTEVGLGLLSQQYQLGVRSKTTLTWINVCR